MLPAPIPRITSLKCLSLGSVFDYADQVLGMLGGNSVITISNAETSLTSKAENVVSRIHKSYSLMMDR